MTRREDSPIEAQPSQRRERGWTNAASAFEPWPRIGRSLASGVFLAVFAASGASAHSYKLGQISIGHVWSPPPAEGDDGVPVYGALQAVEVGHVPHDRSGVRHVGGFNGE